jgi:pimeloyl-ACP methyl ester carboxylesterase
MPRICIPTGVTLDYAESGNPQGPAVVFVHGYLDSWRIWEPALPHLPKSYRLIFVSQRGFGDADKPPSGFTQADYVKDLEAFLGAVGARRAAIVGHSMGGLIAHYFAVRNPQQVSKLVLVGTAPTAANSAIVGGTVMDEINALTDPIDPAFVRMSQGEQIRSPVPAAVFEAIVAETLKAPARSWQGAMAGMLSEDHAMRLAGIRCPVLILYGDGDIYFTMDDQRELQRLMPQARLKIYPGVGHGLQWEKPAEFAADLAAFLAAQ